MDNAAIDLQHQFYDMLMQSQYWSHERMQNYQRSQLTHLLRHARKNVPFYENRLDAVFKSNGEIDWDRWSEIPIVKRSDLVEHREAMQARELPPGHGNVWTVESSGSTGVPMRSTQNSLSMLSGNVAIGRSFTWHSVDLNSVLVNIYGEDPEKAAWPLGRDRGQWGPAFMRAGKSGHRHDLNLIARPEQALDFIMRKRPDYISGLTTRLMVLAHENLRRNLKIRLQLVLTRGEEVTPEREALFMQSFGAKTLALYSSQETHRMAHPCPELGVLHINSELIHLEVIDDNGAEVAPGELGNVVVTPFYNTAQPLVRYQIGDIAERGRTCECGRTLPVLSRIAGRTAHMFKLPGGGYVLPNIADNDVVRLGAQMWQLAQTAADQVEFRYVASAKSGDEVAFHKLLQERLHPAFTCRIVQVPEFVLGPNRKHILYVNETS
jgi:phenylacetate-CoA ligase